MKIFSFFVCSVALVFASCGDSNASTNGQDSATGDTTQEVEKIGEEKRSAWEYTESVDEMTDKTAYFATVYSENSVDFDFPYDGGSTLSFTIRQSPQYGNDMYIHISKGQFNSGISGTKIKVRFDDNDPIPVNCTTPSDYSSDILFLKGFDKLLKHLKESKTMKINVEFFNEGAHTFTFDVNGLEWNH